MPADLAFFGTVLTIDDTLPTAGALAVADGRVVAVGDRAEVQGWVGPDTVVVELGDGCVMPGLIEAHGHPLMEAMVLCRPHRLCPARHHGHRGRPPWLRFGARSPAVASRGPTLRTGGIRCFQVGLPEPTLAVAGPEWRPRRRLVIVHNSGHKAFFNSVDRADARPQPRHP